jgi:hypothetical protein
MDEITRELTLPVARTWPIVCCECGKVHPSGGEMIARLDGWTGFSHLTHERLGFCPECKNER